MSAPAHEAACAACGRAFDSCSCVTPEAPPTDPFDDLANRLAMGAVVDAKLTGELVCHSCGRRERCEAADSARYLRNGWPVCHGQTMLLELGDAP